MGYRDDFYKPENIVGYTGRLGVNPTVYFASADEVGRITQDHPHAKNVGRNKVRKSATYTIANLLEDDGFFHAKEKFSEKPHKSRNPVFQEGVPTMVSTEDGNKQVGVFDKKLTNFERSRLALAIEKFPDLKPQYSKK